MSHTLTEQARKRDMTVIELVVEAINECQSIKGAARKLKCNRNSIRYHLNRNGIAIKRSPLVITKEVSQS